MNEWRNERAWRRLLLTLSLPCLLGVVGMRLLLTEQFLALEYRRPGFPQDVYGFTTEDRLVYGPYALRYLFNGEPLEYLASLRLPGEKCWTLASAALDCALFSERELSHMRDVKRVATVAFVLGLVCAALWGVAFVSRASHAGLAFDLGVGLRRGCQLTLTLNLTLAVFSLAAWDRAFEIFHALFFRAGSWRFPFSDSLIRLYPERLFMDAAIFFAAITSLAALALLLLRQVWLRRDRASWTWDGGAG